MYEGVRALADELSDGVQSPVRLAICWTRPSGYMASCWRALARRPDIDLRVVLYGGSSGQAPFSGLNFDGVDVREMRSGRETDPQEVLGSLSGFRPGVVAVAGWANRGYRSLVCDGAVDARFVMAMDTPYAGTLRQRVGGFVRGAYFKKLDSVIVTGERSFRLARSLGFEETRIRRGCYGVDWRGLGVADERRRAGAWPRRFLFLGRLTEVKGIDTLMKAYGRYRDEVGVDEAWELAICGTGELEGMCRGRDGVELCGFVQPSEMLDQWSRSGALVIASRFDPWPLAIVESCAAGLPIVCTEACGSAVELVRDYYSGRIVATDNPEAMARALVWVHERHGELGEMGARSRGFAAAYSAEVWAERWASLAHDLVLEK